MCTTLRLAWVAQVLTHSNPGKGLLNRLIDAVVAFEDAFERWMQTQVESDHMSARGLFPTVWTKEGQDEASVRALKLAVAEAAGLGPPP